MPRPRSGPPASRRALAACLALAAGLPGCENLSHIDRRIDRVIWDQTRDLDGGTVAPRRTVEPAAAYREADQYEERPRSTNPDASELRFQPAPDRTPDERFQRLNDYASVGQGAREITLADALRISQESAREYLDEEEEYILAAIRLLIERHRWGPRFFNDTTLEVDSQPQDPGGGNYRTALNIINDLRAQQRLPYGGQVEARAIVRATEQLREVAADGYIQSAQIVLSADLPLLRGAGMIAREDLIQAERNLVYASRSFEDFRRRFLVEIASDFYDLVLRQDAIRNQERRLESLRKELERISALVDAGRRNPFERRNVEQNVLRSEDSLVGAREAYILALDRFKIRLGLPVDVQIVLAPVRLELPDPETTPNQAARRALTFRLDLQNQRDQIDDARRDVANARNLLLPELNLSGDLNLNTDTSSNVGGISFRGDETEWRAAATLSLPLDREEERLNLRSAIIGLQREIRDLSRFEDEVAVEARQAVREVERARFSIYLQEQGVRINELRREEILLKIEEVTTQEILDAENELLQAANDRDSAIRDLRIAILSYLRVTGQLRVAADGFIQPLPGMEAQAATPETTPRAETPPAPGDGALQPRPGLQPAPLPPPPPSPENPAP